MEFKTDAKLRPILEQPTSDGSWVLFATAIVFLILVAATRWIIVHPYGIHWDEAYYFNEALSDIHKLHSGSLRQLASILIGGDPFRPPAYRLLALPFLALFGFHTVIARFVTLACWLATTAFIYLTSRRIASSAAAAMAVLVFCLAPEVLSASTFFSTEGPLLLATSAMLYFILDHWSVESGRRGWIGLGLAMGLGLLSKITFILIAFPILVTFTWHRPKPLSVQALSPILKSGALALILAAPWWLKNIGPAVAYGGMARQQPRESFGAPSLLTWAKWLGSVAMGLLGPAITVLICLIVIVSVRRILIKKEACLKPLHRTMGWACVCASLPLVVLQLSGMNHNLRYLTPAVITSAIAVGVLSEATGWIRSRAAVAISGMLIVVQLLMIVTPVAFPKPYPVDPGLVNGGLPWGIWVRFEQWDWKPLRDIASSCGLPQPRISFLGIGRPLNPPQIQYPWFVDGTVSSDERLWRSQPVWLWRYEQGSFDWQAVMSASDQSDIVVTAPHFIGQVSDKQDLDNRYNYEFAQRLAADPLFQGPIRLKMGRFEPVEVTVFVKADLSCHFSNVGPSQASALGTSHER
jgi:4-amino-4-deoxy-L-arabinose transferase-like glycosyltransferase